MNFKLTTRPVSSHVTLGTTPEELESHLSLVREVDYLQVWLADSEGNQLAILVGPTHAYVSSLPITEEWLSAYVPGNSSTSTINLYLENGQLDDFDEADCLPRDLGIEAGVHYMRTGQLPTFIDWRPC